MTILETRNLLNKLIEDGMESYDILVVSNSEKNHYSKLEKKFIKETIYEITQDICIKELHNPDLEFRLEHSLENYNYKNAIVLTAKN